MIIFWKIIILLLAYLLGSIPWGLVLGKMKGIDIREHGSKNIGATNVGRVLGQKYAVLAYILDSLKGALFVILFRFSIISETYMILSPVLYGFFAVIGHTFPIYIKFKGGKAVATSAGIIFGYCPWLIILSLGTFFIVTFTSKIVSVGSLVASTLTAIVSIIMSALGYDYILSKNVDIWFGIIICFCTIIIYLRHKANIIRLRNNTEARINVKNKNTGI